MKLFLSFMLGLGLTTFATAQARAADTKRNVAQAKVLCVPLGVAFNPYQNSDDQGYSADELNMLRNSIYAQVGFKFKSPRVTEEMARRGCMHSELTYSSDSLKSVDKKNIKLLKSLEKAARENDEAANFQGPWDESKKSTSKRAKLIAGQYCYLSDAAAKYFGILYFAPAGELNGMMNLNKPSWSEPMSDEEKSNYSYSVAYKELDTTSAVILDYSTKGTWIINASGELQINIFSNHKNVKNGVVAVTSPRFAETHMLECKLTK